MSESARLYQYKALLEARRVVSRDELMKATEVSPATFKRDIAKMRDQLGMPIVFDKDLGGYRLDKSQNTTEIPGLWFSPEELAALLTIQHLIEQMEPGLVGYKLKPLQSKLSALLRSKGLEQSQVGQRIRMIYAGKRTVPPKAFEQVALATISRHQLRITHFNRYRQETMERTVSPQELMYYRDNWYLNAWCHVRNDLRCFSLDTMQAVATLEDTAREIDPQELARFSQGGYGIFSGQAKAWALLRFSAHLAQWIDGEQWHPQQQATYQPDGSYLLKIPYSNETELLGDILRYGPDVQVLEPAELRAKVQRTLLEAASKYIEQR